MIIPGRSIITRNILRNILSPHLQTQPCGIDLTLRRVLQFASPGTIDLDNTHRLTSNTTEPPFTDSDKKLVDLATGAYLVEFNETVAVPLNLINGSIVCTKFIIPVWNAFERQCCGQWRWRGCWWVINCIQSLWDYFVAQFVLHELTESVDGYTAFTRIKSRSDRTISGYSDSNIATLVQFNLFHKTNSPIHSSFPLIIIAHTSWVRNSPSWFHKLANSAMPIVNASDFWESENSRWHFYSRYSCLSMILMILLKFEYLCVRSEGHWYRHHEIVHFTIPPIWLQIVKLGDYFIYSDYPLTILRAQILQIVSG